MPKLRRTVLSGVVTPLRPEPLPALPVAPEESASVPAPLSPGRRPSATKQATVQQTVYLHPAVHDQLRDLGFSERVKMHALLMEGLDAVFLKRGLKSIQDLTGKP